VGSLKTKLSFILAFTAVIGSLILCYLKGIDITFLLPSLVGTYIAGRTVEKASAHWATMKDPDGDIEKVIQALEGKDVKGEDK
jgi:hypothetical protein